MPHNTDLSSTIQSPSGDFLVGQSVTPMDHGVKFDKSVSPLELQRRYDAVADHEKAEWLDRAFVGFGRDLLGMVEKLDDSPVVKRSLPLCKLGDEYVTCFARMCRMAGVDVPGETVSVAQLNDIKRQQLGGLTDVKVCLTAYALDDFRNHVFLVYGDSKTAKVGFRPVGRAEQFARTFAVTTMQEFFIGTLWLTHKFYSDEVGDDQGFISQPFADPPVHASSSRDTEPAGQGFGGQMPTARPGAAGTSGGRVRPPPPESVVEEEVNGGGANVTGGVVRAKKRNIGSRSTMGLRGSVPKNYTTVGAVMFNNFEELYQDSISRDHAQEIIEDLWLEWRLPLDQSDTMKFAEDMLLSFLIAVTASNKADYNRSFNIPVKPFLVNGETVTELDADFSTLSRLLSYKYNVTRRQFSRALADDQRSFLKLEENVSLLPTLATRVGCEALLAYLAFDGSTHCSNLTTREVSFTKALESRNLFERDDDLAKGASDRLMQGFSGGVRSVAPR